MAEHQKVVYGLSNGANFNDLERPLPPVSRRISQKRYEILTQFQWNTNDLHTPYSEIKLIK